MKQQVIEYNGRKVIIPEKEISELYGFLEGLN